MPEQLLEEWVGSLEMLLEGRQQTVEEARRFRIIFFHDDNLSDIPSIKLLIHVAIARYQAMRGKMENLVRVLDDLRHTVGLAMGPDVANQMAKAAETVKDIANV